MYIRKGQEIEDCFSGDIKPSNVGMTMLYLCSQLFSALALHLRMGFLLSQLCRALCKRAGSVQGGLTAVFLIRRGHPLEWIW